jgi:hypothetical protein
MFGRVNTLLQPFGMFYRESLTQPGDFGFTNVQSMAYPTYLSRPFQLPRLLYQDRLGQIQLGGQEKAIALNTIAYAADGQPNLLAELTALYSTGSTNITGAVTPSETNMGPIVDSGYDDRCSSQHELSG